MRNYFEGSYSTYPTSRKLAKKLARNRIRYRANETANTVLPSFKIIFVKQDTDAVRRFMRKIVIFTGSCHHINGVMRTMLRYLQLYKDLGVIHRRAHTRAILLFLKRAGARFSRTYTPALARVQTREHKHACIRTYTHTYICTRRPVYTCRGSLTKLHGKERKVDRTAQRAEIKGRRGDEFVKKAEAGQQHASRTSKRQDEMKSNRCPSPPLLETLFSSPFASPSSFLYPLSFLSHDFLPPLSAPFFFPFFLLFSLLFAFSLQSSGTPHPLQPTSLASYRLPLSPSLSLSRFSSNPVLVACASLSFSRCGHLSRASRKSKPEENTGTKRDEESRGRGHTQTLYTRPM